MMDLLLSVWSLMPVTLAQGLMYAFVALGVMIPFRLLGFPDLTSEGAFPLGGCLCAALLLGGVHPLAATAAALLAGAVAGATTALIHLRLRVNSLLAGILVFTGLYSVDLRILGKANVALFNVDGIFHLVSPAILASIPLQIAWFAGLVGVILGTLFWFLRTEAGAALRAVGVNPDLAPSLGISIWSFTIAGVALANALSALAGAMVVQLQGYADVGMGFGILINELASLVIGEAILGRATVARQVLAPVMGALAYYQVASLGLSLGLHPSDLKLGTAAFVLLTLALPQFRRGGGRDVARA
jgi:putative ABC transport system permease protein